MAIDSLNSPSWFKNRKPGLDAYYQNQLDKANGVPVGGGRTYDTTRSAPASTNQTGGSGKRGAAIRRFGRSGAGAAMEASQQFQRESQQESYRRADELQKRGFDREDAQIKRGQDLVGMLEQKFGLPPTAGAFAQGQRPTAGVTGQAQVAVPAVGAATPAPANPSITQFKDAGGGDGKLIVNGYGSGYATQPIPNQPKAEATFEGTPASQYFQEAANRQGVANNFAKPTGFATGGSYSGSATTDMTKGGVAEDLLARQTSLPVGTNGVLAPPAAQVVQQQLPAPTDFGPQPVANPAMQPQSGFKPDLAGMRAGLQAGNTAIDNRIATPMTFAPKITPIQPPATIASEAGSMAGNLGQGLGQMAGDLGTVAAGAGSVVADAGAKAANVIGNVAMAPVTALQYGAEKAGKAFNRPISDVNVNPQPSLPWPAPVSVEPQLAGSDFGPATSASIANSGIKATLDKLKKKS